MTLVTLAAFAALQLMVQDPNLTQHEEDAAAIAIQAYRSSKPIDAHVAGVLASYAVRRNPLHQDRFGK